MAAYHSAAWREVLARDGVVVTEAQFVSSFGQRNDTILREWLGADLPDSEIERIGGAKEARYRELVRERGIVLLPGVGEWLRRLEFGGWRQAIASAAPRLNVEAILDALGIRPFFAAVTSSEDVRRGKPDPQVFRWPPSGWACRRRARWWSRMRRLGLRVRGAAGCASVGVRTSHPHLQADIVVEVADLPDDAFDRLLTLAS